MSIKGTTTLDIDMYIAEGKITAANKPILIDSLFGSKRDDSWLNCILFLSSIWLWCLGSTSMNGVLMTKVSHAESNDVEMNFSCIS